MTFGTAHFLLMVQTELICVGAKKGTVLGCQAYTICFFRKDSTVW
jgi:hypothetical protein